MRDTGVTIKLLSLESVGDERKRRGGDPVALFEEFGNLIPSQKLQETQNL